MGRLTTSNENEARRRRYVEDMRALAAIVDQLMQANGEPPRTAAPGSHAAMWHEHLARVEAGEDVTVPAWAVDGVSPLDPRSFILHGDGRLTPIDDAPATRGA